MPEPALLDSSFVQFLFTVQKMKLEPELPDSGNGNIDRAHARREAPSKLPANVRPATQVSVSFQSFSK